MKKLLIVALLLASCAGTKARNDVMLPIAQKVWVNVQVDYEAGLADGLADGDLTEPYSLELFTLGNEMTAALELGDVDSIPWSSVMRPWAVRGVQSAVEAGELGPNGSLILFQRIANFTAAISSLTDPSLLMVGIEPVHQTQPLLVEMIR